MAEQPQQVSNALTSFSLEDVSKATREVCKNISENSQKYSKVLTSS